MATRSRLAVAGAVALGLVLTACSSGSSSIASNSSASSSTSSKLGACPQESTPTKAPEGGAGEGGATPKGQAMSIAKTVKPTDTSTSTVIDPTGPQMQCGQADLSTHKDIVYSSPTTAGKKVDLKLDLQVPKGSEAKPLVVYITGGGFVADDKTANIGQRTFVADQGYAVASIEYRTTTNGATYKDGVADVKSAIRYLRAHADEYGIDGTKVAVWGQSAGGYLAAMAGTTNGDKQFDIGDNLDQSSEVQAVVDEFGAGDLSKIADDFDAATQKTYNAPGSFINAYVFGPGSKQTVTADAAASAAANPATYVNSRTAPFILLQGDNDHIISPSQSLILADALKAKGVDATRYVVKGANHGDMSYLGDVKAGIPWSTQKVMGTITSFLGQRIGG
ncbi:prolyl oligopeptidase family serine peptidase [Streptomyces sp. NPDC051963]|uniref:prolyl oligopeptidase family serine peptidase n=1 Tax=Streptomyces sp. NPDC051963 TaxID=3365678 RepID=UPI0037D91F33